MANLIIGIDLGQQRDYTAVVILERTTVKTGKTKGVRDGIRHHHVPVTENHYEVRHIERQPLGTPYPQQEAAIAKLYHDQKADHEVSLVVDFTGVGVPVVDALRAAQLPVTAVYIHGGSATTRDGRNYNVPKGTLASLVLLLLQTKRLGVSSSLPEARLLIGELHGFKYEQSQSGHLKFGNDVGAAAWREQQHDDLVLATALGTWWGENQPPPRRRAVRSHTSSVFDW